MLISGRFTELANFVSNGVLPTDFNAFAVGYLDAFNTGFHYAFLTAVVAMGISLIIFLATKRHLPTPKKQNRQPQPISQLK